MSQEKNQTKEIIFNLPQALMVLAPQSRKYLEAGRGLGKSTIFGWQLKELAHQMPRSSSVIVGETYQQILTRTLPSTIASLERLGFYQGLHYFIGRTAPKSWKWEMPYEPPLKFDYYMHWYTGAGFHFVSQDRPGSGRGINSDAVLGDEMTILEEIKLFNDVFATNRGNLDRFGKCPLHHSEFFCGTVPMTSKGRWVYNVEKEAQKNPSEIFYLRASAEENRINLGEKFFKDNQRRLPDLIYKAEILNIRPDKIEGGFYALLNEEKHTYTAFDNSYLDGLNYKFDVAQNLTSRQDGDLNPGMPIDIAMDYGASINVIVAGQEHMNAFRFINCMYVKHPLLTKAVVDNFCDYYSTHRTKVVNYYYDHTAIGGIGTTSVTYQTEVVDAFRAKGWHVNNMYIGQASAHHVRYLVWNIALSGDGRMVPILINRNNARVLLISMLHAGVRQGSKGFEKDKTEERNKARDQSETTHASDAADTLLMGKYYNQISKQTEFIGDVIH